MSAFVADDAVETPSHQNEGVAVRAREELLATGEIGFHTLKLLIVCTIMTARRYGFPPPDGHQRWEWDAASEWLSDVFFVRRSFTVPTELAIATGSAGALSAQCSKAIRWTLQDEAKSTPVGLMMGRLDTILARVPEVVDARSIIGADGWSLVSSGADVFGGDWADLLTDPALRDIEPLDELNSSGPTSRANVSRLTKACLCLLQRAQGAVRAAALASAIVSLFGLEDPGRWAFIDTDSDDPAAAAGRRSGAPEPSSPGAFDVDETSAARALLSHLTPAEQRMVVWLEEPLPVIQHRLPHDTVTYRSRDALKDKLRQLHQSQQPSPGVWGVVLGYCDDAYREWAAYQSTSGAHS